MPTAGMNEADREKLIRNICWLADNTDIDDLVPQLVNKGIFTAPMVEKYKGAVREGHEKARARDLYLAVTHRGPTAFAKLVEAFVETGNFDAALKLDPDFNISEHVRNSRGHNSQDARPLRTSRNHSTVPMRLPEYLNEEDPGFADRISDAAARHPDENINLVTESWKVEVKMATTRMDRQPPKTNLRIYKMGSRPKGYFLMINNVNFVNDSAEDREGAQVDEKNLKDLFEGLGYVVVPYRNQGYADMKRKIREFAARREHKDVDSCVVSVLSHGYAGAERGGTFLVGSDGGLVSDTWIVDCFNNSNCPYLIGKPKIFIFQACRGLEKDFGARKQSAVSFDGQAMNAIHSDRRTYSDILLAYSTLRGYVAMRDHRLGSWYIEALCKVFMDHAHDTDIRDMLSMVDTKIKDLMTSDNEMQTSSFDNWGFQKFYFNPGLYDDEEAQPMALA